MAYPFHVWLLFLLFSLGLITTDGSIRVTVDVDVDVDKDFETNAVQYGETTRKKSAFSYSVVDKWNGTLFEGGDLAVFMEGRWCVAPSKYTGLSSSPRISNPAKGQLLPLPLTFVQQEITNGTTPGLGRYNGIRIRWSCNIQKQRNEPDNDAPNNTQIITSFLNFESEQAVIFSIEYPDGAENTSLVNFNQSDGETATLATFPSFVMKESSSIGDYDKAEKHTHITQTTSKLGIKTGPYFPPSFPSVLSWEGSFVQSVREFSVGPRGGPTVFYNASDPALETVVVVSPFFDFSSRGKPSKRHHYFNQFTAGNNKDWTGTISAFSPGRSGRLTKIPPGSSYSILFYEGSRGGITSTVHEWGTIMQTASTNLLESTSTPSSSLSFHTNNTIDLQRPKLKDLTLEKIGYQTDNGAMYCFCRQTNCSELLLEEKAYLDSIGIPIGYLSFQGAGTSSGRGKAAPWCVEQWSADGGQDPNDYPMRTKAFQNALGVPLQLYAPYFCPNSTRYFKSNFPWKSVTSNPDLPGCSGFAFETASPTTSKEFFEFFLTLGIVKGGMASFESDFMNQNANCVDNFVEEPIHGADEFLGGMAEAALEADVPIQWCYASPNVVLSSLAFPAVTNFRVSFDYCYGKSYEIGESSLLVWAVGAAPSKDTLWTTENNRTETPGCSWTEDHEAVAAELHVVLAIMSTGPVGISDAIGMTNATLLERIISRDGSLLQPSKPITAVDSSFLDHDSKPIGFLYGTHGLELSWIFVSFRLRDPFSVTLRDFWPPLEFFVGGDIHLVHRSFGSSPECLDGANAITSGCVTLVSLLETKGNDDSHRRPVFVAPPSSYGPPGSELSPNVVTVWRDCPKSGVFFLGELDKYVALSPKRFQSVDCDEKGVSTTVWGIRGEVIEITLLIRHVNWYEVEKQNITITDPDGLFRFEYRTNDSIQDNGVVASE